MPADRSQTERIRHLRSKIQAVRRAECAACPEEGPQGPTDQSTRLSRSLGQMIYYRQSVTGAAVTDSCCPADAPSPSPPGPCGICAGSGTTVDLSMGEPILDPTQCYSFFYTNPPKGFYCINFTSGITVTIPNAGVYPPAGYSLTGVQSITIDCPSSVIAPQYTITSCTQTGDITDPFILIANEVDSGNNIFVTLTSTTGGCSTIYVPYGQAYQVIGAISYSTTCLTLPVPLKCDLCPTPTLTSVDCSTDVTDANPTECYAFTQTVEPLISLTITASNITFNVDIANGETYPPMRGIFGVTSYFTNNCVLLSCAIPFENATIITSVPASGSFIGGYIQNESGSDLIVSLSNGTDCCAVFLSSGGRLCGIQNATLYDAVQVSI